MGSIRRIRHKHCHNHATEQTPQCCQGWLLASNYWQGLKNNHALCTSCTRGMRSRRTCCSRETERRCRATNAGWPSGLPRTFIPCCSSGNIEPRHTLAVGFDCLVLGFPQRLPGRGNGGIVLQEAIFRSGIGVSPSPMRIAEPASLLCPLAGALRRMPGSSGSSQLLLPPIALRNTLATD